MNLEVEPTCGDLEQSFPKASLSAGNSSTSVPKNRLLHAWGMGNCLAVFGRSDDCSKSAGSISNDSEKKQNADREICIHRFTENNRDLKRILSSLHEAFVLFHSQLMEDENKPRVCANYLLQIRTILLDAINTLDGLQDQQSAIAHSLKQCAKYIDFYRIHFVLNYPTEYLYQYFMASFLQDYLVPSPDPSTYQRILRNPRVVDIDSIVSYLKELTLYGNMNLLDYFISSLLNAGIEITGLRELHEMVQHCPFSDPTNIPTITLTQIAAWRKLCRTHATTIRLYNSALSEIASFFTGVLPKSTWERELLWDILYRKDVLPRYAIAVRLRQHDEELASCSHLAFNILSHIISNGMTFLALSIAEVMTLLDHLHTQTLGKQAGQHVTHTLLMDYWTESLRNENDRSLPVQTILLIQPALPSSTIQTMIEEAFLMDPLSVGSSSDVYQMLHTFSLISDASTQFHLTQLFLTTLITNSLRQKAFAMAALWEKELIQRCVIQSYSSRTIASVISYFFSHLYPSSSSSSSSSTTSMMMNSNDSNDNNDNNKIDSYEVDRARQVIAILKDVHENITNYSLLKDLIKVMMISKKHIISEKTNTAITGILTVLPTLTDQHHFEVLMIVLNQICSVLFDSCEQLKSISLQNLLHLLAELHVLQCPPFSRNRQIYQDKLKTFEQGILQLIISHNSLPQ